MQVRSLCGPLVPIALGALLLYSNFHPELSLTGLFAHHWPWVLVIWGGLRVVEILAAHSHWLPIPAPLGAGAFLLVVILCAIGSLAHAIERDDLNLFEWHGSRDVRLSVEPPLMVPFRSQE